MIDYDEIAEQDDESATLGETLTKARQACQLSQCDLAAKLYLGLDLIRDIENDRLDSKINPLFSKGYIKSYAKVVAVEKELALRLFEQQYQDCGVTANMQSFSQRNKRQTHNRYLNSATVLIIICLSVMSIAWWWQQQPSDSDIDSSSVHNPLPEQLADKLKSQDPAAIAPALVPVLQVDGSADTLAVTGDVIKDERLVDITQQLEFTFSKDCWVKVTDASNEVLAIGIKKAGRVMQLNGIAPFEVTLGAPEAVSISYQGTLLDITSFITGKTARFNVPLE